MAVVAVGLLVLSWPLWPSWPLCVTTVRPSSYAQGQYWVLDVRSLASYHLTLATSAWIGVIRLVRYEVVT